MYDLAILNDKEFEILCKDLLECELKISFQNFRSGKDQGIDLRVSRSQENEIIVQAKHYPKSSFSHLKKAMYDSDSCELRKMQRLSPQPKRYILFTTFDLSSKNVDQIFSGMSPFIKSTDDIYGASRVVELLGKHKEVEKKHFKLWLTSTNVLENILNNGALGKAEFQKWNILRNISKYVSTNNLSSAEKKLKRNKFIIITGLPGIGKTTISNILIYGYLAKGFQLISIDDKISEVENLFNQDPKVKQVFYFDDFLGANVTELSHPRNSENALINFISRIQHTKNKYLVLTSRTTILKKAEDRFEKLERGKFSQLSKYEVELSQYSLLNRAQILYNHVFHSELGHYYIEVFYKEKFYFRIIKHKNYSQRLIDFITDTKNLKSTSAKSYSDFILQSLDYPGEVWRKAYENNLNPEDRYLVMTLFSFGGYSINITHLEIAFDARVSYEVKHNGIKRYPNMFRDSVRQLLDGFFSSVIDENGKHTISFINPSLVDFLLNYVTENKNEKWCVLNSAVYLEQFTSYFHYGPNSSPSFDDFVPIDDDEVSDFFLQIERIQKDIRSTAEFTSNQFLATEILKLHQIHSEAHLSKKWVNLYFTIFNPEEIERDHFEVILRLLQWLPESEIRPDELDDLFPKIILKLFTLASFDQEFKSVVALFDDHRKNLDEFLSLPDVLSSVSECVNGVFEGNANDDLGISEETEKEIRDLLNDDESGQAEDVLKASLLDDYDKFIKRSDLGPFIHMIKPKLDLDMYFLMDGFKTSNQTKEETIDLLPSAQARTTNDNEEIENLFDNSTMMT
jgi:hypothetical protein